MNDEDRIFWMAVRQALLTVLDALERRLSITPRTSELRARARVRVTGFGGSGSDGS